MDKIEGWPFIQNFFENRTRGTYKVTDIIVEDHHDKLTAAISDTFINTMMLAWIPYYTSWKQAWNGWRSIRNSWHTCTRSLENALRELLVSPGGEGRSLLDDWEKRIAAQWPVTSALYQHFFPQGREEFTTGAREATIQAVQSLSSRLIEKLPLLQTEQGNRQTAADVYTQSNQPVPPEVQRELNRANARVTLATELAEETDAFHSRINTLRGEQQGCEGQIVSATTELEEQRIRICRVMFKNFHDLASKHMDVESAAKNPQYAAVGFFDLNVLMRPKSEDPPDDEPPPAPVPPPAP